MVEGGGAGEEAVLVSVDLAAPAVDHDTGALCLGGADRVLHPLLGGLGDQGTHVGAGPVAGADVDLAGLAFEVNRDVLLAPVPSRVTSPLGTGGGQCVRSTVRTADHGLRLAGQIREVGDRREHVRPAAEFEDPPGDGDGAAAVQGQDQELVLPGGQGVLLARLQGQDPEAGV